MIILSHLSSSLLLKTLVYRWVKFVVCRSVQLLLMWTRGFEQPGGGSVMRSKGGGVAVVF